MVKRMYHRTDVLTIGEMVELIEASSRTNIAVLCRDLDWYHWRSYLNQFFKEKVVTEIASHHNFVIKRENGLPIIYARRFSNSESVIKNESVLADGVSPNDFEEMAGVIPLSNLKVGSRAKRFYTCQNKLKL